MVRRLVGGFAASTAIVLLAACSSGSGGTATASPGQAAGGENPEQPTGTARAAGNGDVTGLSACSLLTPADIKGAIGADMKPGVEQDSDGQVDCEWDSHDDAISVGVTVATFDQTVWDALSSSADAKPISGFGEQAFTGIPHQGDISIKTGGYEVDVAIIDFTDPPATVDAADQSLAKLVLSRL